MVLACHRLWSSFVHNRRHKGKIRQKLTFLTGQFALWIWEGGDRSVPVSAVGQNIVSKTVLRVNLNHFGNCSFPVRLSISGLNRAYRSVFVLSGTNLAVHAHVDSYSGLN
jgi:hypothetical protein